MTIDELSEDDMKRDYPDKIVNFKMITIWESNPCEDCSALLFKHEPKGFCCCNGNVKLKLPDPPYILKNLLMNNQSFKTNIRGYNNALSLASLGIDKKEILNDGFSPSLKFQGTLYHQIGPLKPNEGEPRRFAQLYIHDASMTEDDEVAMRLKVAKNTNLKPDVLRELQDMLHKHNPYVHMFKALGDIPEEEISEVNFILRKDKKPQGEHERRFNLPDKNEIAVISLNDSYESADVLIRMKDDGPLKRISDLHPAFDPLRYILLFVDGQEGWNLSLKRTDGKKLTHLQFYNFMLQVRDPGQNFNSILRSGRLCQEYILTSFHRIERQNLFWLEKNQKSIKAEKYQGIYDAIHGQDDLSDLGQKIILPASHTCSPRWYQQKFQDSMAICRQYGKPSLFLTFSANAKWQEIEESLYENESSHDRPDIVNRVFEMKRRELKLDIKNNKILGECIAHVDIIEFQKRCLPHTHLMIWLAQEDQPRKPEDYDRFVCAEFPDPDRNPELFELVRKFMIHGPCGKDNPKSQCMVDGKCSKGYPKPFQDITVHGGENIYPKYRRRRPDEGGFTAEIKIRDQAHKEFVVDNSWIIPYNPVLLLKFQAHINLELVASVQGIKYLFKYFHKGPDRVMVEVEGKLREDEIKTFINARYTSSNEAHWRMSEYKMSTMYPSVQALALHLPNEQTCYMDDKEFKDLTGEARKIAYQKVLERTEITSLTKFFQLNDPNQPILKKVDGKWEGNYDPNAKDILYPNILKHYTWNKATKQFLPRSRSTISGYQSNDGSKSDTIGRIPVVAFTPKNQERYFYSNSLPLPFHFYFIFVQFLFSFYSIFF